MKLSEIQLVPELQALFQENNEYEAIKADIAERGIQEPVKVNKHNHLLAGYTRLKIAQELGLDEVPHIVVDVDGDMSAMLEYAILDNLRRRQLTKLQMVEYGMDLEKLYEGRNHRPQKYGQIVLTFQGETRDLVADKLSKETGEKMSGKTYERLKTIVTKAATEVKEKLNAGEITQSEALDLTKLKPDEQIQVLMSGKAIQRQILKMLHPKFKSGSSLPEGKFDVIYADPPWQYDNTSISGAAENHYPSMTTDEICALGEHIPAAPDSVLFLWVTPPMLKNGLRVLEAWGFEYRSLAVWDKGRSGIGWWFRGQCELLFVGRKGNFPPPAESNRFASLIRAPREEHSQKPWVVYEMIEKMYPTGKYLELFARNKRKGWTSWGNELA